MVPSTAGFLLLILALGSYAPTPKLVVPDFPDFTVKVRRTYGDHEATVETLYLKGARQRSEHFSAKDSFGNSITITQCDQRLRFSLDPAARTYVSFPIEDWAERVKHAKPLSQPQMSGADVTVTIDSADTGETRQIGPYVAHHVKTTQKVEPGPGAVTPASLIETDGWYLAVVGLGCEDSSRVAGAWLTVWSGKQDRMHFKVLGKARRGYAIEETSRKTQDGQTTVSKVELVEFSGKPLGASLFEVPSGYARALRQPAGGYDMTRADTLPNRLQAYWEYVRLSTSRWFR